MNLLQQHRERVGRQIRRARKDAGLSHDKLAAAAGTSRQHLIRLEKGEHVPRAELLQRIAEATGKEPAFFAGGEDEDDEESSMTFGQTIDRMLDRVLDERVEQRVERRVREILLNERGELVLQ